MGDATVGDATVGDATMGDATVGTTTAVRHTRTREQQNTMRSNQEPENSDSGSMIKTSKATDRERSPQSETQLFLRLQLMLLKTLRTDNRTSSVGLER